MAGGGVVASTANNQSAHLSLSLLSLFPFLSTRLTNVGLSAERLFVVCSFLPVGMNKILDFFQETNEPKSRQYFLSKKLLPFSSRLHTAEQGIAQDNNV